VTLRIEAGIESIAREWLMKIIRKAIGQSHKGWFQIVEFNVLTNHLHLITEARDKLLLARGIQGLEVRIARRLNKALKRKGRLFAHRYHVRHLRTPREVRNALRYVLLNRKHHAAEQKFDRMWIDPYSSAAWFDGWAQPIRTTTDWKRELVAAPAPTAKATTWLLKTGWRRYGPLSFADTPARSEIP
jgi:REP element-mobilizing transposase RayT